jgi:hypothetical protein
MKDILTESELRFLRSQGLGPDDVMDVRHMSQWHWFQRIKEEGKSIALGSIVVPIRSLRVTQDRSSFFLPILKEVVKKVPVMPDQDYNWLSDQAWRAHNDAFFEKR